MITRYRVESLRTFLVKDGESHLPESLVTRLWQHLRHRTDLATEEGEPLEVVYPGRVNDDRGADLRDVVLHTRHGLKRGDLEFHVKSSDWQAHRHYLDPSYNKVILHVVMWRDTGTTSTLQNGDRVAILAMHRYLGGEVNQWLKCPPASLRMPCRMTAEKLAENAVMAILDAAGQARFLARAARFEDALAHLEPDQALYQGIMTALGYAKNKAPFLELARLVPVKLLAYLARSAGTESERLARRQALLLGTAGLLPSQRFNLVCQGDSWVDELERLWRSFHVATVMPQKDWHLFKVRPNNFPVRRIAAVSYLVRRYEEKGLLTEVVDKIKETPLDKCHELKDLLVVTTEDYWSRHFDFGSGDGLKGKALIGEGRAGDMVVNVCLPFTFAWSQFTAQEGLALKSLSLYAYYPALTANAIERHMIDQLGIDHKQAASARRQQGLIHIYQSLCSQGRCGACPLVDC